MHELDRRLRELPPARVHEIISGVGLIDEFKGRWTLCSPPRPTLLALSTRVVETSALASDHMADARWRARPLGGGRVGREPSRERPKRLSPQAAGYAQTLRSIFSAFAETPLTEAAVFACHEQMLKFCRDDQGHRGKYRDLSEHSGHDRRIESPALRALDPDLTPAAMAQLIAWTRNRLSGSDFHPLLVIAAFVLEFLAIRPFKDGNARLSRLLTHLLLLQSGYVHTRYASLDEIISKTWTDYYMALRHSQANRYPPRSDISPWLCAFLGALKTQTVQLKRLVDRYGEEALLSERQQAVVRLLAGKGELTNRGICSELGIARESAKQILNRLLALSFIRRVGAGRAVRYRRIE